jgi:hypothetical protein
MGKVKISKRSQRANDPISAASKTPLADEIESLKLAKAKANAPGTMNKLGQNSNDASEFVNVRSFMIN